MRVLAVSSYGEAGGAELSLATFVEHRPATIDVGALLVTDGPLRSMLVDLGIRAAVGRGYEGKPSFADAARFARSLTHLLARCRPDVVWATGQKAALLAVAPCRSAGVPLVWHKVDFSRDRWLAKPLALAAHGVVAVSHSVAEALGPLRRSRLLGVVGPPIRLEPDFRAHLHPARPTIGTLGRLVPYKGHHHILRAAAILSVEFPSLQIILAGGTATEYPDYPAELRTLARELGLSDRLELPGHAPARDVLDRLTVFVNATYRDEQGFGFEGLSGAMLEASWVGVPVVATRGGGTEEGVVSGETGFLVDEADPALLAAAIRPYLADASLAARTGDAGRAMARDRYAPERASTNLFGLLGVAAAERA